MGWIEKKTIDGMAFYVETDSKEVSWQKPAALMSREELEEENGEWVWVPHPTDVWQEARMMKRNADGSATVQLRNGDNLDVPKGGLMQGPITNGRKQKVPLWEVKKSNLRFLEDDLVMLDPVNEAFIIRNLAERYKKAQIYTWVGDGKSVLVSVNPYKDLGLYGADQIDLHRLKPANAVIHPHVFDVANEAYDNMCYELKNQSILISGESGAGKTEATKQCLKYLASVAGSGSKVEDKVLVANPLLEAFGNAKTIRNINSSRFGKWMEVYFNRQTSKMQGAKIINYLLERSRVVHQQKDERNFHIFYQLCVDSACRGKFSLEAPEAYRYMNQSGCIKVPQLDDQREFNVVKNAMAKLEFTPDEQESIIQLTAAVLWLGNIEFETKQHKGGVEGSSIIAGPAIEHVSKFLQVDPGQMAKILCYRTIRPKAGSDSAVIPLPPRDARIACDSLAMGVYGKLFNWMVLRVNQSLGQPDGRFIGILDIFGFEIFENNSFEQLCINYANERLQGLFNQTTFKEEEELYRAEGVNYTPIHFIDNQPVLDLIEAKPQGILTCLDDECLIPEGSDTKFMKKIEDYHGGKDCFLTEQHRRFENTLSFEIKHYAGIVKYDASQFMVKNVDTVYDDMYQAMNTSSNDLLKLIFDNADRKIKTLSNQFRGQLQVLMTTLFATESKFIRTIKPNDDLSPNKFTSSMVVEQLRYSGVFEAVDIRKTGYPFRYTHKKFAYRYSCININAKYKTDIKEEPLARCKEILDMSSQDFSEVQMGNTMVLYRANEYKLLKLLRNLALEYLIPKGQGLMRGGVNRRYFDKFKVLVKNIDIQIKAADNLQALSDAIKAAEPRDNFTPGLLKLYNYYPRNIDVALVLQKDLAGWVELEKKMADLVLKCSKGKPDPYYDELMAIDRTVEERIKTQNKKEADAKVDFYKRKAYTKPKLTKAQKDLHVRVKALIQDCIRGQIDTKVEKAVKAMSRVAIIAALEEADKIKHTTEAIKNARVLLGKFEKLDEDAKVAVKLVSKTRLQEILKRASELKQDNQFIQAARSMDGLQEKAFVEEEHARAAEVGDEARRVHREIRLLDFKLEVLDESRAGIQKLAKYRPAEEYAKAKFTTMFFGKQALMDSQKVWVAKPIPTALTKPEFEVVATVLGAAPPPEAKMQIKIFKTEAKMNFSMMQIYMGDKPPKKIDRDNAAFDILQRGLAAYNAKNDDMLMEMYLQIIKQLTGNPTKTEEEVRYAARPEENTSYQNGVALLAMMMSVFPASSKPYSVKVEEISFDDALITWVNNNIFAADRKRFISAMHNVKFGPATTKVENPTVLRNRFTELRGKYSLDPEHDSGPEPDKVQLYLA